MKRVLPPHSHAAGFTLAELMVTVAIIGILSSIALVFTGNEWRRERINTVAIELAGWLEEVRAASLRETNAVQSNGGCVVRLGSPGSPGTALNHVPAGTVLASVDPTLCRAPNPSFTISGFASTPDRYSATFSSPTATFTPRGSTTSTSDITIHLSLDGSVPLRCVQISSIVGMIRIGGDNAATGVDGTCTYPGF